ncbi:MAG: AtpZ/AtpI family protein [Chitinophagales bacterium]|nr:AtpZ/AtpI family protein [Chitinophagales bacterium]MDW8393855.1 AtpZ/AtpI family protein [Chitinophagales bacterium]
MKRRLQPFRKKPSDTQPPRSPSAPKHSPLSGFARYFHLVYLMAGSIGLFFAAGYFLDFLIGWKKPFATVFLAFAGVMVGLYLVLKELRRPL